MMKNVIRSQRHVFEHKLLKNIWEENFFSPETARVWKGSAALINFIMIFLKINTNESIQFYL